MVPREGGLGRNRLLQTSGFFSQQADRIKDMIWSNARGGVRGAMLEMEGLRPTPVIVNTGQEVARRLVAAVKTESSANGAGSGVVAEGDIEGTDLCGGQNLISEGLADKDGKVDAKMLQRRHKVNVYLVFY